MEEDGIITRTVYAEVPPRVEYALSELGENLRPVLETMRVFGLSYQEQVKNQEEKEE
jgi:DNA-binding HxlR family transcriptional regulator